MTKCEGEMWEEEREMWKKKAEKWLTLARERCSSQNVDFEVTCLRRYVKKARIKLEDIGTSEEELEKLLHNGYRAVAEYWFELARERSTHQSVDSEINYVRDYVKKAKITFKDIGTSEKELEELLLKGYKAEAEHWLRLAWARCTNQSVESEINYVRKYAALAKITLEDIGTSEDELEKLVEKGRKAIK
jgi:urocanate hydratase